MTRFCLLLLALLCLGADIAFGGSEPPPTLDALLEAEAPEPASDDEDSGFAYEKRRSAIRAAALAFGSQGGLAKRGWEIARMLERHGRKLSAVYRFRDLMLQYHGFTVMPPVLAETGRAFRLDRGGARAASARRVLRIVETGKIVSAVPHWRDLLVRDWPEAVAPGSILFPRDAAEASLWQRWLRKGWAQGTALADDIFAADLERLNRVFEGLVLWRRANLAGMVTAPALENERVAVSGHEGLMRIDETVASIGESARFELRPRRWTPRPEGDDPSAGNASSASEVPSAGGAP